MQLNGNVNLNDQTKAKIGTVVPLSTEQKKTLVLNAVAAGHNTFQAIKEVTKLDGDTIAREIDILNGLIIATHPGPPVPSYWLCSKLPKGRVWLENGRVIAEKEKKTIIHNFKPKSRRPSPVADETAEPLFGEQSSAEEPAIADTTEDEPASPPASSAEIVFRSDEFRESVPLASLLPHPENPRGGIDESHPDFADLVESIRAQGVQQPPIVTQTEDSEIYRIVIGHRRCAAARAAGLDSIPAIIRFYTSAAVEEEAMLIENMQRQDLNPIQEAKALKRAYNRENKNIHAVARKVGLTQSTIASRIKLLRLEIGIQIMIERREISLETGLILSELPGGKQMRLIARAQRMKSSDLREVVRKMKNSTDGKIPVSRQNIIREKRVTTDEERFTRTGAIKTLDELGDGAWVDVSSLKRAFDDVCIDSCLETKDETICNGCPVPRFIASLTRRHTRREQV